ncbi:MAG: hypothetical protein ACR2FH_05275 [Caulobacteraceae bacterium]
MCRPIDLARSEAPGALRAGADRGDGASQYALSIVLRYGLRGAPPDSPAADRWRRKSLQPRGFTPITSYIAGVNGRPGRVISTSIPRYDLTAQIAGLLDQCVALLAAPTPGPAGEARIAKGACGGPANFERLECEWVAAGPARG